MAFLFVGALLASLVGVGIIANKLRPKPDGLTSVYLEYINSPWPMFLVYFLWAKFLVELGIKYRQERIINKALLRITRIPPGWTADQFTAAGTFAKMEMRLTTCSAVLLNLYLTAIVYYKWMEHVWRWTEWMDDWIRIRHSIFLPEVFHKTQRMATAGTILGAGYLLLKMAEEGIIFKIKRKHSCHQKPWRIFVCHQFVRWLSFYVLFCWTLDKTCCYDCCQPGGCVRVGRNVVLRFTEYPFFWLNNRLINVILSMWLVKFMLNFFLGQMRFIQGPASNSISGWCWNWCWPASLVWEIAENTDPEDDNVYFSHLVLLIDQRLVSKKGMKSKRGLERVKALICHKSAKYLLTQIPLLIMFYWAEDHFKGIVEKGEDHFGQENFFWKATLALVQEYFKYSTLVACFTGNYKLFPLPLYLRLVNYAADSIAVWRGQGEGLAQAIANEAARKAEFPVKDWLYSMYFDTSSRLENRFKRLSSEPVEAAWKTGRIRQVQRRRKETEDDDTYEKLMKLQCKIAGDFDFADLG